MSDAAGGNADNALDGIVAILLAAGSGSRFGADKLMHALPDGTPVAVQSARHLRAALPSSRAVAVVRPGALALTSALTAEGFEVVICEAAVDGMGHSLAHAVRAAPHAQGWVVALADMPFIEPATIVAVSEALAAAEDGTSIIAPRSGGRRGHPVGIAATHGAALMALTGDEGARRLIASQSASTRLVDTSDPGILQDIDTPADLRSYLR